MMRICFSVMLIAMLSLASCGGKEAVRKGPKVDLVRAAEINVQLASGYMKRGQYKVAMEKLEKAQEQDPRNLQAHTTMAVLLTILGQPIDAENNYLDALDIKENDPDLHNSYGTFLCGEKRLEEAFKHFRIAYTNKFYEHQHLALANAGSCYLNLPDYIEAEILLRRALKIAPRMPLALFSMGKLALNTNQHLKARAFMQRYHAQVSPDAASLWVQLQAEKILKDEKHYIRLARKLLNEFPDSPEAEKLEALARDERKSIR